MHGTWLDCHAGRWLSPSPTHWILKLTKSFKPLDRILLSKSYVYLWLSSIKTEDWENLVKFISTESCGLRLTTVAFLDCNNLHLFQYLLNLDCFFLPLAQSWNCLSNNPKFYLCLFFYIINLELILDKVLYVQLYFSHLPFSLQDVNLIYKEIFH